MSVSTHVLDAVNGVPAVGLTVTLEAVPQEAVPLETATTATHRPATDRPDADRPNPAPGTRATSTTDTDGRIADFDTGPMPAGAYRLVFATGSWFAAQERETFYPEIVVSFTYDGHGHVHVPVLLSPFAYTTYRGS